MSQSKEFDRLEQFVRKLLTQYEQLLDKNAHMQRLLQQRENEIMELKEKINSADSERGDISNRIKHLIEQIEEWQSAVTDPLDKGEDQQSVDQEPEVPQEEEPAGPEEASSENIEEEESESQVTGSQRNQRNLFHVGPEQE